MKVLFALFLAMVPLKAAPTDLVDQPPQKITRLDKDTILIDFGKVAFANLRFTPPANAKKVITVHFGEAFKEGRIDRNPPGSVRYNQTTLTLQGDRPIVAAPPADVRNTKKTNDAHPPAILTPEEWGVVLPFRWVEIEGWPGELKPEHLTRQAAFSAVWNDEASHFESSDDTLNRIWDLCKYSIKATSFAGIYLDGDRERIPYEADCYLNQLSHYYTDNDSQFARDTYDRLINFATWPTEWAPHMIFIAHAEWMRNGDTEWLTPRYERLKTKALVERAGSDGLIISGNVGKDIIDWPPNERDDYVRTEKNTVINAFHLSAIKKLAVLAKAIGKDQDAQEYLDRYHSTLAQFQKAFFDSERGVYRDGIGTEHASQHANFFPLAFGLVPEKHIPDVLKFLDTKGMSCSVYGAQYLLEALFDNDSGTKALQLMLADNDRSWRHMVNSGTTITWEAWDQKYKTNQDWNHAWGAAPANLLPRYVLGAESLEAGWKRASIRPHTGTLKFAKGKIPTPRGPILIDWKDDTVFTLKLTLPEGLPAKIEIPAPVNSTQVLVDGQPVQATKKNKRWHLDQDLTGTVNIEVK